MKLVPLGDRVVLKELKAEETTKSGIVLPGQAQEKPQQAEVIAVGPGKVEDGKEVKMEVAAVLHVADVVFLALNLNIRPLLDQVGNLFDIFNELADDADARDILHLLLHLFGRNALSLHFFQNTGNTLHTAAHTLDR